MSVIIPQQAPLPHARETIPSIASITTIKRSLFEAILDFHKKPLNHSQKIEWLKTIKEQATALRTNCCTLQKICERAINNLPWYTPTRFLFCFAKHVIAIFEYGELAQNYFAAQATIQDLVERIHILVEKEVLQLSKVRAKHCKEGFDIAHIYEELHTLEPENAKSQTGLAEWLLQEGVYDEAQTIFTDLIKRLPKKFSLQFGLIQSLMGQKKHEEAEQKIVDLKLAIAKADTETLKGQKVPTAEKLEEMKAECLVNIGKHKEALTLLRDCLAQNPKSLVFQQKIILYSLRQELDEFEATELDNAQKKFFLAKPKKMFGALPKYQESTYSENTLISEFDFWIMILFSQQGLHNKPKLKEFVLEELEAYLGSNLIPKELLLKRIEDTLRELNCTHSALNEGYYALLEAGARDLQPRQLSILRARIAGYIRMRKGDSDLSCLLGFEQQTEIAKALLEKLSTHSTFQDNVTHIRLTSYLSKVNLQRQEITSCEPPKPLLKIQSA